MSDAATSRFAHDECGASWTLPGDIPEAKCLNCDVRVSRSDDTTPETENDLIDRLAKDGEYDLPNRAASELESALSNLRLVRGAKLWQATLSGTEADALLAEIERLREVAHASAELMEVLLRGSPGWLDTPAGRRLVEAGAALDHKETA